MTPEEQSALLRLLIDRGVFTLDEFLDEVPRATRFRDAFSDALPRMPGLDDLELRIEQEKALELRDAYLEHGRLPPSEAPA